MKKQNLLLATLLTLILAGPGISVSNSAAATAETAQTFQTTNSQTGGDGLSLTVGLILYTGDSDECGTETDLEVNVAENVNICYTMTNNSNETLDYQSLTDSVDGPLLQYEPITLEPGDSHVHVRTVVAEGDVTREASWEGHIELARYDYDNTVDPEFLDISATGTDVGFVPGDGQRGRVAPFVLDFPIKFYEHESSHFCVTDHGLLLFDDVECPQPPGSGATQGYLNQDIPTWVTGASNRIPVPTFLAPMWQSMSDAGRVYYEVVGEEPDRQLIVQWHEIQSYHLTDLYGSLQIVMNENGETIRFEYENTIFDNTADNGAVATIGMQADPEGLYTKYSYYEASLTPYSAIEFTYTPPVELSTTGNSVRIDAGVPRLATSEDTITVAALSGDVVEQTLTIENVGQRDLHWSIHQGARGQAQGAGTAGVEPAVSAYGMSSTLGLIHMDASDPENYFNPIGGTDNQFYASTFLDNDFSKLYGVVHDSWDYSAGDFGTIDLETGEFTQTGELLGGHGFIWTGLVQDPTTGTVYIINGNFSGAGVLYVVNLETGQLTAVGDIDGPGVHPARNFPALAISPEGRMYTLDLAGQQLLEIDKTTAEATVVASVDLNIMYFQDLVFDPETHDLYWSSMYITTGGDLVGEMRLLDPSDGSSTPLGEFPPSGGYPYTQVYSLAIEKPAQGCIEPAEVDWLSVSHDSGIIVAGDPGHDITVTLDGSDLDAGLYQASICIFSDDPLQPGKAVAVNFAVSGETLHDQMVSDTELRAFNNTVTQPIWVTDMSSEGADDFVITDSAGWDVAGFWFSAYGTGPNPPPTHINLRVHADDDGQPGDDIMCLAPNLETAYLPEPENRIGAWLPGGCDLPAGHYWVVWSFADVDVSSPFVGYWGQTTEQVNEAAVWRNPGGMTSADCTDWSTFDQCGDMFEEEARDFGFSVFSTERTAPSCDLIFSDAFAVGSAGVCKE